MHRRLVYIYLLNVPSFSCRYFNKIKRTSRLGRLHALSLEILQLDMLNLRDGIMKTQLVIFNLLCCIYEISSRNYDLSSRFYVIVFSPHEPITLPYHSNI